MRTTPSFVPRLHGLALAGALAISLAPFTGIAAQQLQATRLPTLRLTSGAFIPTGLQRQALARAHSTAVQLSWEVRPSLAVVGTLSWSRSKDIATSGSPRLDVFSSDLGVESRTSEWCASCRVSSIAFAGIGGGARSYNYRKLDVDATNNLAAYVSVGSDLGVGRAVVRLEARDYVSGFRPLQGAGVSQTRNDVMMLATVRFNRGNRR